VLADGCAGVKVGEEKTQLRLSMIDAQFSECASTADTQEPQDDDEAQRHAEQPQKNQNHVHFPFIQD
jgi:hypothetical protein